MTSENPKRGVYNLKIPALEKKIHQNAKIAIRRTIKFTMPDSPTDHLGSNCRVVSQFSFDL
jgi:hypothetical protein